jgi:hypothetical protein
MKEMFEDLEKTYPILKDHVQHPERESSQEYLNFKKKWIQKEELNETLEEKIINEIIGEGVEMDYIPRMKDTDLLFDKIDLKKVFQKLKDEIGDKK